VYFSIAADIIPHSPLGQHKPIPSLQMRTYAVVDFAAKYQKGSLFFNSSLLFKMLVDTIQRNHPFLIKIWPYYFAQPMKNQNR